MAQQPKGPEPEVSPSSGRGLWQVACRRMPLVLCVAALAVGLGVAWCVVMPPVYQASAQVLVLKKQPDAVTGVDSRTLSLEDYVAIHQALIRSPLIVERACQKRNLGALQCLAGARDNLTETVIQALSISRGKAASGAPDNILSLSFRGRDAGEAVAVIEAVIESYKDFLEERYRDLSSHTLKLIADARDVLKKELSEKEAAYGKFRQESPLLLGGKGRDGAGLRQERLASIEAKRASLLIRKTELQAQLAALTGAPKEGGREAVLALIASWTAQADGPRPAPALTVQGQLHPLLMEEQKLLESRGPNHPDVIGIRKRIEVTRNLLVSPSAGTPGAAGEDPVTRYRGYCRQQLKHCDVAEELLAELAKKEQEGLRRLIAAEVEDDNLRADIERRKGLYDAIVRQLNAVDLAAAAGGYEARVIAPPARGKKVQPNPVQILPAALLLGLLAGLSLAYLVEIRDRTFRTAEEVRRTLGLPVVGHVPFFKSGAVQVHVRGTAAPDPMLCAHHRPSSAEAEAYRGVRTALFFGAGAAGRKVIQVTSPSAGDGKTLLAANLAVSMAQAGKRVLLLDADLRKPRLHRVFGLEGGPGLAAVLGGTAAVDEAVRPTPVPGLSVLPCGPRPANPAELLTAPAFEELLRRLRDRYDFVIVDTPALLAVTDPRVVAPRVDGVLLNVRVGNNGRPLTERAREVLADLDVPVVGVVINAMDHRGRHDYGQFGAYSLEYGDAKAEEAAAPTR